MKNRIKLSASPAYTPHYNRVAKHFNQTIMEMVRAMLFKGILGRSSGAGSLHQQLIPTQANADH
jgi:hypothetical protein